ncbi:MAG TPA: tetratricopeptide repeat protein [Longimicrobiales bacterium]|nr:tetratricopeptide repeat protein [Longimicrobiales bacterium]
MVREIRRSLMVGLALTLAAGSLTGVGAQQRYKVLVPDLLPQGAADQKFGETVATRLRALIDDMNTHQSVAKRDMEQGLRRLKIDSETVDCTQAKQLAADADYPLTLCATYEQGAGGMAITAEFVDVRSGEAFKVSPKTFGAGAVAEAAQHMFGEFSNYIEEIRASAICSDYVNSEIWEEGLRSCGRAVELNPNAIGPRLLLARIYRQTERLPEALAELKRVLEINPAHQESLQMAGYIASQLKQNQEALDFYGRYLDVVPGNSAVRTQIAYQFAQAGDPRAAMELIQKGVDHDPANLELWEQLGGYAFSAGARINAARTDSSAVSPEAVPLFRKAIEAYEHLFEAKGAETAVPHLRSTMSAYMLLGEMDKAVAFGQRAVQSHPNDPDLWWVEADALQRAGHLPEALAALDRVTALKPDYPMAGLRRGEWLLAAGRLDEAASVLKALATADPTQADAAGGLLVAHAYAKGVQPKRWSEAIPPLEAARGILGLSSDTNEQINFWLAFSIMQGTIPQQEARTVETAKASLPRFQRARELFRLVGSYPSKVRIDLGTLVTTVDQYIEIQETIIRRGR